MSQKLHSGPGRAGGEAGGRGYLRGLAAGGGGFSRSIASAQSVNAQCAAWVNVGRLGSRFRMAVTRSSSSGSIRKLCGIASARSSSAFCLAMTGEFKGRKGSSVTGNAMIIP